MLDKPIIRLADLAPVLDDRPLRKRIGLIILATDHTSEPDFARMVSSEEIGVYVTRIPYANPTTPENLRKMQPVLTDGARLLLPDAELDAICYSCTSASVVIGDEEVAAAIRAAKPGVPVVTPTDASVKALQELGAKRISVLTPYTVETSQPMADYFTDRGFDIRSFICLGLDDDRDMARISHTSLIEHAKDAIAPDADALFISCTAVRAAAVVPRIEDAIGKPVVSSNLASAWACLRICGDKAARPELGQLMTLPGNWA
ncbi:ectoine utilization protein EutA [Mesorhizobium sp. SB112]|uniref:ectoine utilization protein EutA n=1 Tax=Mesorhizobium sp. SB112 TaxID=3151853 RepID=UPI0032648FF2